jgi:hypothetical protein
MSTDKRKYLGDGAYYEFDGDSVWLSTDNGIEETNRICLDPMVVQTLLQLLAADFGLKPIAKCLGIVINEIPT